ncbi:hypothetical protein F383_37932 [Gossypium arboreum]|uniref:Uncharacterized protein n=1 Tax=Gossypium arboreum TaxID=29729 RepID=A0A0B0MGF4_GOSAR|nr:hypothetical protein F383_37932 [Gossypium arboreum]
MFPSTRRHRSHRVWRSGPER